MSLTKTIRQALQEAYEKHKSTPVGGWPVELDQELESLREGAEADLWVALSDLDRWYYGLIPSIDHGADLTYFVMQSDVLGQLVVGKTFKMRFDPTALNAFVELKTRQVTIPGVYFMREYFRLAGVDDALHTLASVAMVNGSQMHEALHLAHTKLELEEACRQSSDPTRAVELVKINPHFALLLQVAEDLYIEARSEQEQPMHMVVVGKNHVLFPPGTVDRAFTTAYSPEVTPQDLVGMMPQLKCVTWREDPRWEPWAPARDLLLQATDVTLTPGQRVDLVLQLFDQLDDQPVGGQGQPLEPGQLSKDSVPEVDQAAAALAAELAGLMSELMQAAGISLDDLLAKQQAQQVAATGAPATMTGLDLVSQSVELLDQLKRGLPGSPTGMTRKGRGSDLKDDLDEAWEAGSHRFMADRIEGILDLSKIGPVEVGSLQPSTGRSPRIRELPTLAGMAQELRYQRTIKRTPGQLMERGSVLRDKELWRLNLDGLIMSNKDSRRGVRGVPEVIAMGDISGSTNSTRFEGLQDGESLRDVILSGLYTTFMQLRAAKVHVSTWVHTTRRNTYVVPVASHGLPLEPNGQPVYSVDPLALFNAARALPSNQNMDGVAIEYVLQHFSPRSVSKLLLMLCDGEPSGDMFYWGLPGRLHTKSVVDEARRRGIAVVVLSLVEDVVEANDSIYGAAFNVHAYGGRLDGALRLALSRQLVP